MKLLAVSGTFVPMAGGAEHSLFELLEFLRARGSDVEVCTTILQGARRELPMPVWEYPVDVTLEQLLRRIEAIRPDAILTQLIWSDLALQAGARLSVPVIYFARGTGSRLDLSPGTESSPWMVVANSRDTKHWVDSEWGVDSLLLHPVVRSDRFQPRDGRHDRHLLINPLTIKGGARLPSLARLRPNLSFATVFGWEGLRVGPQPGARWNDGMVRALGRAGNKVIRRMPDFVQMPQLPNLEVLPSRPDTETLYAETRVLLLPSTGREALSRSVVEAAACGVPSIVSAVGGMREAPVPEAHVLSADASDQEWAERLDTLQEPHTWARAAEQARCLFEGYREENDNQLEELWSRIERMGLGSR